MLNCFISRDVGLHQLAGDRAAAAVVVLVAVDAADQHRLAVHEQLPVADLDAAEADVAGRRVSPAGRRPPACTGPAPRPTTGAAAARAPDRPEPLRRPGRAASSSARLDFAVGRAPTETRRRPVARATRPGGPRRVRGAIESAREPGVPPLVLVLDEARVRPAHDDGDELVRPAVAHEVGDVELGRRARVLRDPDRLAVHQHVEHALDAAEVEHDRARPPAAGHGNERR